MVPAVLNPIEEPAALNNAGKNNNATAINNIAIGVPIGICVGLSLCCLNFMIEAKEKPNPAKNEAPVINFAIFGKLPTNCAAIPPKPEVAAPGGSAAKAKLP